MATGDNTLTAISVARECNILNDKSKVFFGDIENEEVVWRQLKASEEELSVADNLQGNHTVNFDLEDDDYQLALNGKVLHFMNLN